MADEQLTPLTAGLLKVLPGVAYVADRSGIVVAVGGTGWFHLSDPRSPDSLAPERFVGRSLFDAIAGDAVRQVARCLHKRVLEGDAQQLDYPYRCDAPDRARFCRMTMTPVRGASGIMGVFYHSRFTGEYSRPPIGLFDTGARSRHAARQIDVICSYCQRVVWPTGARDPDRTWIEAEEFHRRGGSVDAGASHGVCPTCLDMLVGSAEPAANG